MTGIRGTSTTRGRCVDGVPDHRGVRIALAQVISAGERERLRRCEAPDCDDALIDLSRNRSKRYCDARTCGNRLHVAAYRERRKASGE